MTRCIRILRLLDGGDTIALATLATDHDTTQRTIRRNVNSLIVAGEPIELHDGKVRRVRGPNLNPASVAIIATRHAARNNERGFNWVCNCPACRAARRMGIEPSIADAAE